MRAWTDDEFAAYLDSGLWIGKSGEYGLELPHDPFVTQIAGSASNVVGVPLERLDQVLAEFDVTSARRDSDSNVELAQAILPKSEEPS